MRAGQWGEVRRDRAGTCSAWRHAFSLRTCPTLAHALHVGTHAPFTLPLTLPPHFRPVVRELIIPVHEATRDSQNVHLLCMGAHALGELPEEYQVLHNRAARGVMRDGAPLCDCGGMSTPLHPNWVAQTVWPERQPPYLAQCGLRGSPLTLLSLA